MKFKECLPNKSGEYLFYFGNAKIPFYAVDELIWTKTEYRHSWFLKEHHDEDVTHWWPLPNLEGKYNGT